MTQYQNQLQEDFLSDFDSSIRKEVGSLTLDFAGSDDAADAAKSAATMKDAVEDALPINEDSEKTPLTSFDDDEVDYEEYYSDPLSFWYDKVNVVSRNARDFLNIDAKKVQNIVLKECIESAALKIMNVIYSIPKFEEELKIVSAICLFFYGGSWVRLASVIAAVEIFDTKGIFELAFEVGHKFLTVDDLDDEDDVTPSQLLDTSKSVGMHFALILAVIHCGGWAEICITFAFASKLSTILRLEEIFDDGSYEYEEFTAADADWFELLSSIAAALISLILYGIFPGVVTALYMSLVGLQFFFSGQYNLDFPAGNFTSSLLETSEEFVNGNNKFSIWIGASFTALWQSYYSYSGSCVFLSWFMFMWPLVMTFNFLTSPFNVDMSSLKLQ